MPRLSASLEKEQYAWVESESESRGDSMAEVVRWLIDKERGVLPASPTESPGESVDASRVESLEDRVSELESRLARLESPQTDENSAQSDLLEYVRQNQPVSKSDIIDACYPDSENRKPDTWYRKEALPLLKDSELEYVHNVGWTVD